MKFPFINNTIAIIAGLPAMLAVVGFAVKETDPLAPVTVSKHFISGDGTDLAFIGACKASADNIDCWDADGKANDELSEKIRAYYLVQPGADLSFQFGKKNRLIVFQSLSNAPGRAGFSGMMKINDETCLPAGQLGNMGSGDGPNISWYRVATDPGVSSTSAVIDLNVNLGSGFIPLKEGAEAQIGPLHLKINSIKRGPDVQRFAIGQQENRSSWKVATTITGYNQTHIPDLDGRAYDAKGTLITHLDSAGNPLPEERTSNNFGGMPWVFPNQLNANVATDAGNGTLNQELDLPVKPSKVEKLQLNATGTRKVTVTDILLDPK